jgi:hypothetical protein
MPFDAKELIENLYPGPKVGEWVPCEYGLPKEFELVVFLIDDGSTEGRPYMGYREGQEFRSMYDFQSDPFPIGGLEGVHFWTLIPDHSKLFDECR